MIRQFKVPARSSVKYNNKKTVVDGITFDSQKEANRYCELKLLKKAGEITDLRLQVPYILIEKNKKYRATTYKADFVYKSGGREIVEDTKGYKTDMYKLKKKMMYDKFGIDIYES